jgi:hypothetical protein
LQYSISFAILACLLLVLLFFIGYDNFDDFMIFGGLALLAIWFVWSVAVVAYRCCQLRVYSFFRSVDEENEAGECGNRQDVKMVLIDCWYTMADTGDDK